MIQSFVATDETCRGNQQGRNSRIMHGCSMGRKKLLSLVLNIVVSFRFFREDSQLFGGLPEEDAQLLTVVRAWGSGTTFPTAQIIVIGPKLIGNVFL